MNMQMKSLHTLVSTALAAAVLGGFVGVQSAWAANPEQPTIQSLSPSEVASGALTPQMDNGIHYVSGGIGIEERAWLAAHGQEFNTHVTFAVVPGGEFIADVKVQIVDGGGKTVLDTTANGPQLMAQLPAGKYQLAATHDGQTLKRAFTVSGKARSTLVLGFKQ
ncbi:MAG: hypothetical protein ACYC3A_08165 [Halothiobacillus sp.]